MTVALLVSKPIFMAAASKMLKMLLNIKEKELTENQSEVFNAYC